MGNSSGSDFSAFSTYTHFPINSHDLSILQKVTKLPFALKPELQLVTVSDPIIFPPHCPAALSLSPTHLTLFPLLPPFHPPISSQTVTNQVTSPPRVPNLKLQRLVTDALKKDTFLGIALPTLEEVS